MSFISRQPNRWYSRSLHLLGFGTSTALVAGFYALVYQPLEQKTSSLTSRIEQLDQLMLLSGTEGNEYRQLRDQLETINHSIAEVRQQLAEQSEETEVINQLNALASGVGLSVLDYQIGLTESLPTHTQTEVEFRCLGSYASICQFLDKAEQFTKTTKLSKFELNSQENSGGYPIQLSFVLYSNGKSHDTKEKRGAL